MTLSGATTLDQSGSGSDGNEGVLYILKAPVLLDLTRLFSGIYPGHSFRGSYPSAEK